MLENSARVTTTAGIVVHSSKGLLIAEVGRVCVAFWKVKSTRELFEIQREALADIVERYPGEAGFLCVVERTSEPPDEYVRLSSAHMITAHGTRLACIGCVSEGAGFRAAITRSVMSGMVILMHNAAPLRIFESVSSASKWMARLMPVGPSLDFEADIEALRLQWDRRHESNFRNVPQWA